MTPKQHAEQIVTHMGEGLRQAGGVMTPQLRERWERMIGLAIQDHVDVERIRCKQLAWKMQMEKFGGGTAIGNAIESGQHA